MYVLFFYQIISLFSHKIDTITFIYGLYLYALPVLLVILINRISQIEIFSIAKKLFIFALPFNLVLSFLQTEFGIRFNKVIEIDNPLTTFAGVIRAMGSFSSPAGLAIYLQIVFVILLVESRKNQLKKSKYLRANIVQFSTIVFLSGSRTVIFSCAFIFTFYLIFALIANIDFRMPNLGFLFLLSAGFFTASLISPKVVNAFKIRFVTANSIDDPLSRFVSILIPKTFKNDLLGEGLGARALGSVYSSNKREIYARWIEYDNARILIEGGLAIFILIVIMKFYIFVKYFIVLKKTVDVEKEILTLFLAVIICNIFTSQIFGQGTISSGFWLCVIICENIYSRYRINVKNDTHVQ